MTRNSEEDKKEKKKVRSDDFYCSDIPEDAEEKILSFYAEDENAREGEGKIHYEYREYKIDGEVVGYRQFDREGRLIIETPVKNMRKHGTEYTWFWYDPKMLSLSEPYEHGLMHGTARQWGIDGSLMGTYTMERGTGYDIWRKVKEDDEGGEGGEGDESNNNDDGNSNEKNRLEVKNREDGSREIKTDEVYVSEIHSLTHGKLDGFQWWINPDQKTIIGERHWIEGFLNGIERQWTKEGILAPGYPKFYIDDKVVEKDEYLKSCKKNKKLPTYNDKDDQNIREFLPDIIKEEAKKSDT